MLDHQGGKQFSTVISHSLAKNERASDAMTESPTKRTRELKRNKYRSGRVGKEG